MGEGIDLARAAGAGVHADVLDDLKDQLLIVFLKRLQALSISLVFPLTEVDNTGQDLVSFRVDPVTLDFHFELGRKE